MASLRTRRDRSLNVWPGYVDALATLLLAVVFLLTIPVSVMRYRKLGQQDSLREAEAKPSPSGVEPPPVA